MDVSLDDICTLERSRLHSTAYRLAMSTLFSVAALITAMLNLLILISIWKTPALHKPSFILIGSLALSDFLVGAVGDPLMVIENIADLRRWSPSNYCLVGKCAKGVASTLGAVSLLTLTFISVDRLLAVKLRTRYQSVVTHKRVVCLVLTYWITASVFTGTFFGFPRLNFIALLVVVGVVGFSLILIITICYAMAFYSLRKITSSSVFPSNQNQAAVSNPSPITNDIVKYRKSLITMFVVLIFNLLFYSPYVCVVFAGVITADQSSSQAAMIIQAGLAVGELIVLLNSAVNPLLYLWRIRDIAEAVKTTVQTIFKIF